MTSVVHYPRLDTVLVIEEFIRDHSGEFKKKKLWQNLPKKTMYQTFCVVFDYLKNSNKIAMDSKGKVAWIWNPDLVKKYLSSSELLLE